MGNVIDMVGFRQSRPIDLTFKVTRSMCERRSDIERDTALLVEIGALAVEYMKDEAIALQTTVAERLAMAVKPDVGRLYG